MGHCETCLDGVSRDKAEDIPATNRGVDLGQFEVAVRVVPISVPSGMKLFCREQKLPEAQQNVAEMIRGNRPRRGAPGNVLWFCNGHNESQQVKVNTLLPVNGKGRGQGQEQGPPVRRLMIVLAGDSAV